MAKSVNVEDLEKESDSCGNSGNNQENVAEMEMDMDFSDEEREGQSSGTNTRDFNSFYAD